MDFPARVNSINWAGVTTPHSRRMGTTADYADDTDRSEGKTRFLFYPVSEIVFALRIRRARDRLWPRNEVDNQPNNGRSRNPSQHRNQGRIRRLTAFRVFHNPNGYPEPDDETNYPNQTKASKCRKQPGLSGIAHLGSRGVIRCRALREQTCGSEKEQWQTRNEALHRALIRDSRRRVSTQ